MSKLGESRLCAVRRDEVALALVAFERLLERAGRLVGLAGRLDSAVLSPVSVDRHSKLGDVTADVPALVRLARLNELFE